MLILFCVFAFSIMYGMYVLFWHLSQSMSSYWYSMRALLSYSLWVWDDIVVVAMHVLSSEINDDDDDDDDNQ